MSVRRVMKMWVAAFVSLLVLFAVVVTPVTGEALAAVEGEESSSIIDVQTIGAPSSDGTTVTPPPADELGRYAIESSTMSSTASDGTVTTKYFYTANTTDAQYEFNADGVEEDEDPTTYQWAALSVSSGGATPSGDSKDSFGDSEDSSGDSAGIIEEDLSSESTGAGDEEAVSEPAHAYSYNGVTSGEVFDYDASNLPQKCTAFSTDTYFGDATPLRDSEGKLLGASIPVARHADLSGKQLIVVATVKFAGADGVQSGTYSAQGKAAINISDNDIVDGAAADFSVLENSQLMPALPAQVMMATSGDEYAQYVFMKSAKNPVVLDTFVLEENTDIQFLLESELPAGIAADIALNVFVLGDADNSSDCIPSLPQSASTDSGETSSESDSATSGGVPGLDTFKPDSSRPNWNLHKYSVYRSDGTYLGVGICVDTYLLAPHEDRLGDGHDRNYELDKLEFVNYYFVTKDQYGRQILDVRKVDLDNPGEYQWIRNAVIKASENMQKAYQTGDDSKIIAATKIMSALIGENAGARSYLLSQAKQAKDFSAVTGLDISSSNQSFSQTLNNAPFYYYTKPANYNDSAEKVNDDKYVTVLIPDGYWANWEKWRYSGVAYDQYGNLFVKYVDNFYLRQRLFPLDQPGLTEYTSSISTVASFKSYGTDLSSATSDNRVSRGALIAGTRVYDVVSYKDLQPNTAYTLRAQLVSAADAPQANAINTKYLAPVDGTVYGDGTLQFVTPAANLGKKTVSGIVEVPINLEKDVPAGEKAVAFEALTSSVVNARGAAVTDRIERVIATHQVATAASQTLTSTKDTARLKITKVDPQNRQLPLHGAEFAIYSQNPQTATDAQPISTLAEGVDENGDGTGVYTSGDLAAGTYWLVETKAPTPQDGELPYQLLPAPVPFTVAYDQATGRYAATFDLQGQAGVVGTSAGYAASESGVITTVSVELANVHTGTLPKSGGIGVMWSFACGSLIVACGVLWARKRAAA